ncbi:Integrase zinc binding domain [Popillia japonica]|uniref:RNA-directed DNA polymerase n=1 Tax=Popillia japonica TaxID=7064 RepID=A0AAW1HEQ9_POPJA
MSCLKLEEKRYRADSYKPPSRKRTHYVEPDLACVTVPVVSSCSTSVTSESTPGTVADPSTRTRCFNCDKLGHMFRSCTAPRRKFCYKCGELGVTVQKYYWPKLRADVANYVRRCAICLGTKPEQRAAAGHLLSKSVTASRPWQIISADLMGPLPRTSKGYTFIFVVCDIFSKFVLLFPLRAATASKVVQILEEQIFLLFGAPKTLVVDNGVQFRSRLMQSLAEKYGVHMAYNANYHAQCNPTERVNRVVKTMLTAYVKDRHRLWDSYLQQVGFAIRSSKHEVTGQTPNFVNFGRELTIDLKNMVYTWHTMLIIMHNATLLNALIVSLRPC